MSAQKLQTSMPLNPPSHNQIKYSEGLATSFELRQAQTQLYATQQEYLQSMVDVINRKTTLENILNK